MFLSLLSPMCHQQWKTSHPSTSLHPAELIHVAYTVSYMVKIKNGPNSCLGPWILVYFRPSPAVHAPFVWITAQNRGWHLPDTRTPWPTGPLVPGNLDFILRMDVLCKISNGTTPARQTNSKWNCIPKLYRVPRPNNYRQRGTSGNTQAIGSRTKLLAQVDSGNVFR